MDLARVNKYLDSVFLMNHFVDWHSIGKPSYSRLLGFVFTYCFMALLVLMNKSYAQILLPEESRFLYVHPSNENLVVDLSQDGRYMVIGDSSDPTPTANILTELEWMMFQHSKQLVNFDSGAVIVYEKAQDEAEWEFNAVLKSQLPQVGERFGHSLAVSEDGRWLAVGAPGDDLSVEGIWDNHPSVYPMSHGLKRSGAVHVFRRQADRWSRFAFIKAQGLNTSEFGYRVAISGNHLLVSSKNLSPSSASSPHGVIHVYGLSDQVSQVVESHQINGKDLSFGRAIAIDGERFVSSSQESRTVHVFEKESSFKKNASQWRETQVIQYAGIDGVFGYSLALNGEWLAVGIPHDGLGGINEGSVYIFQHHHNQHHHKEWLYHSRVHSPKQGDYGDGFGDSIDLVDDYLMVGETYSGLSISSHSPYLVTSLPSQVYFFEHNNGAWQAERSVFPSFQDEKTDDFKRMTVSLARNRSYAVGSFSSIYAHPRAHSQDLHH